MEESRVVLIDGSGSEWYEQVIFILKSPKAAKAKNLVLEAEKIINEYLLSGRVSNARLERYKKNVMERAAANAKVSEGRRPECAEAVPAPRGESPNPTTPRRAKKQARRKFDITSLLINICLVLCSVLLGYMLHTVTR